MTQNYLIFQGKIEDNSSEDLKNGDRQNYWIGLILAFTSGIIFTANNAVFQKLSLSHVDLLYLRGLLQLFSCLIWAFLHKHQLLFYSQVHTQALVILQGFAIGFILLCSYQSLHFLPLGDAMAILFSSPIFTVILECIIFKKRMGIFKSFFTLTLLFGVVLVAKPVLIFGDTKTVTLPNDYYIGLLFAIGASLTAAIYIISVAKIKSEVSTSVLLTYSSICTIFISILVGHIEMDQNVLLHEFKHYLNMESDQIAGYVGIAIMGLVATFMVTQSCKMADPSTISFVRSLEIVFAFCADYWMHGDTKIHPLSIAGASLIAFSVIVKPLEEKVVLYSPKSLAKYI